MVSTSLKTDFAEIYANQGKSAPARFRWLTLCPHPVRWRNYPDAAEAVPFGTYLQNTLWLCADHGAGRGLLQRLVAYGFARLEFRGKNVLFLLMISTMALPGR